MRMSLQAGLLLALLGCASSMGTNYDPAASDQLVPGTSTTEDAKKVLGEPNNETFKADSSVVLLWMHSTGRAWGGGTSRHLAILFDKNGKMVRLLTRGAAA